MINRRAKNAEIFRDTENRCRTETVLKNAIASSCGKQILVLESDPISVPAAHRREKASIVVSGKRSLEAAEYYAKQGKKTCVLNFASATNPGGGVVHGSSAQEESICRCSTLYPCLNSKYLWQNFYSVHREARNPLHNNDCVYTPDVCVFKSDTNFPEPLCKEDWWKANILTCAAPHLRERPSNVMNPCAGNVAAKITYAELERLLKYRIRRIFEVAASHGNDVFVLGAFGCGAFRNPPEIVARVFNDIMQDFLCHFESIEYAVFHIDREVANYEAFKKIMG